MKFTKIVATVNASTCTPELLMALYKNGMDVVRFNTAHMEVPELEGDWSDALKRIVGACMEKETWARPSATEIRLYCEQQMNGETPELPHRNTGKVTPPPSAPPEPEPEPVEEPQAEEPEPPMPEPVQPEPVEAPADTPRSFIESVRPKAEKLLECNRLISSLNLRNFKVFDYNDKVSLEANVSSKCDLVICLPSSTGFDSIATTPDFFLHFDKEAMDARLKEQAESLDSCAEYVEDGGTLLYGVLTISKKEGAQNVAEFLKKHPEFTLEQEKQCFPFEELGTAFYFAKLKKGNKLATIEVPVSELGAMQAPEAHLASAKQ